jgi:acetyltransferase-like isoleucine patch superfamily enzyme
MTDAKDRILDLFYSIVSKGSGAPLRVNSQATIHEPVIILKPEHLYIADSARVDSWSKLECGEGMYIGPHVHIASMVSLGIGGGILIMEEGSACSSGARIITGSNVPGQGHGCSAIDPAAISVRSFVHICRNAIVFSNAVVLPGVILGENSVVAAGAVVSKDVPAYEVWGGVPAKKIGEVR